MRNSFPQFIFNRFRRNEARLHDLNYLFWECTLRCNLNCRHCGSDCHSDADAADMPFDDFLRAVLPLQKEYKKNSITVAITGGEPLMREDLPRCGRLLRENGFLWGMVTNGYDYSPEVHGRLLAAGMGSITLSLDGLEASHNWLRGRDESFARAVRALDLIVRAENLTYDVVTCVNGRNIDELETLMEFLVGRKVRAWRLFTIFPIGRAADDPDMKLSPEQLRRLMDFMVKVRSEGRIRVTFSCEAYVGEYERKVRDSYFFCRAGIQIGSVLADGSISACPNINRAFVQGNIYRDDFLDVWQNRFAVMRDRRWTKVGICRDCPAHKNCDGGAMHMWNEKREGILDCLHCRMTSENRKGTAPCE